MLKMRVKIGKFNFANLTISKKITILYSSIFTLSLLVISILIVGNANYISQKILKGQINETIENIENFIKEGNKITNDNIQDLLAEKYIEVQVNNYTSAEVVKSAVGSVPPFVQYGVPAERRMELVKKPVSPDDAKKMQAQKVSPSMVKDRDRYLAEVEKNALHNETRVFTIDDNGTEFMLCEKSIKYKDELYLIQAYKYLDGGKWYIQLWTKNIVIINLIGIFLAILIARYISKLILRPIGNITDIAERISIEDLSKRIDVPMADDEFKELTITFNSMIDRLEKSFIQQKTFISDASHELRTPISVIQGYAKLINRWGKSDPVVLQESIDSIVAETDHMIMLIKKLLYLAKGEQKKINIHLEALNLNSVAEEIVKELNVMDCHRNIILEDNETVEILGDGDLIKQLLWIHCENAIKYTKDGGNIKIKVYIQDKFGCISIEDDGAGIDEESIPYIFDRFYRVDKARNKEIPGTGLGLSIAKWIIEGHKGKIEVKSKINEGTIFINKFKLFK